LIAARPDAPLPAPPVRVADTSVVTRAGGA
jgi:hypothetical protein